jgi:hypothetical protein
MWCTAFRNVLAAEYEMIPMSNGMGIEWNGQRWNEYAQWFLVLGKNNVNVVLQMYVHYSSAWMEIPDVPSNWAEALSPPISEL